MKSFRLRFYPNPLEDHFTDQTFAFKGDLYAEDLPDHCNIEERPLEIRINGIPCTTGREIVTDGDEVIVAVKAKFETLVAVFTVIFEAFGAGFFAAGAYATAAAYATVIIGSYLLNRATNPNISRDQFGKVGSRNDRPSYSLTSSANQARLFEPIPVIMGAWRYVPDYDTRPWSQYIQPANLGLFCLYETDILPRNAKQSAQSYSNPLIAVGSPAGYGQDTMIFGANTPLGFDAAAVAGTETRSGLTVDPNLSPYGPNAPFPATWVMRFSDGLVTPYPDAITQLNGGAAAQWVQWSDARSDNTAFDDYKITGGNVRICRNYTGYEQQITQILNFGFGDLTISDYLVGNTKTSQYADIRVIESSKYIDDSFLTGHPNAPVPNVAANSQPFPLNVVSRDGSDLNQTASPPNYGYGTIRSSPKGSQYWQIDVSGQVFRTNGQGFLRNECEIDVAYAVRNSSAWIAAQGSPFLVEGDDSNALRRTFTGSFPNAGEWDLRVTKITKNAETNELQNKVILQQVKFFQAYGGAHPAQNRVGVIFQSSSSLNGSIDALSGMVYAKTWVYTGVSYGGEPIGTAGWAWQHTENPAWWSLYWALGGYTNKSTSTAAPFAAQGWNLGDHPQNEERLFGCGLPQSRINLASVVAFANFCTSKNLRFSCAVIEQSSADDVLRRIAKVGRATTTWQGGKLGFVWEAERQPIIAQFGMSNIIAGSFSINYTSARLAEEIVVQHVDPDNEWRQQEVRKLLPGITIPAHEARLDLWGVKYREQALREANLLAAAQTYQNRRISWQADMQGARITKQSVVAMAHDLTQWAYSGRFISMSANSGGIVSAVMSCDMDPQAHIMIQLPDATQRVMACSMAGNVVTFGTPLPLVDGPSFLDDVDNPTTRFSGTVPEDFYFQAGPTALIGKRIRIIDIRPQENGIFTFTGEDDAPEKFAREYDAEDSNLPYILPDDPSLAVARIYNLSAESTSEGIRVMWERDHCAGATITLQINGGAAYSINATGDILVIAAGQAGDVYNFGAVPYSVVNFAQNTGDSLSWVHP